MIYIRYDIKSVGLVQSFREDYRGLEVWFLTDGLTYEQKAAMTKKTYPLSYDEFMTLFLEAQQRNAVLDLTSENMPNVKAALAGKASFSDVFVKPPALQPPAAPAPGL